MIILTAIDAKIEARGSSRDISLSGVFVKTDTLLEPGTQCGVKIFLTGGSERIELSMKARVARVLSSGLGISFESMELETYAHLKNIMLYNSDD
ncbi:hypothetical protein HRM2_37380 [Desulforapulum autotrophicum HRM2]|uniref:PilZ domain-containing protein n=1 Tax=Desulforapulum autotrophicum (strain ATCC 43914 / DSM 3382 / VKM B-1955 / HRM2) TaxID=177437 RepID=C0QAL3_DESAH|nr:hypothetical protein HRM2_37380 [Desulforapulum autotrophicum HRM2]